MKSLWTINLQSLKCEAKFVAARPLQIDLTLDLTNFETENFDY